MVVGYIMRFFKSLVFCLMLILSHGRAVATSVASATSQDYTTIDSSCETSDTKSMFISGWYPWEPFQYEKSTSYGPELAGIDIDLITTIVKKLCSDVHFDKVNWDQHITDIKSGVRDIALGATFSEERSQFAYFSEPYRYEQNSLFMLKSSTKVLNFKYITQFLAQIRAFNFKIGIEEGAIYADNRINGFINDPTNSDIVIKNDGIINNLRDLINGKIDGFLSDRLVGTSAVVNGKYGDKVQEIPLDIKVPAPIHIMFSKKTISPELLEKINAIILSIKSDGTYEKIVRNYLYPAMLMQTSDSDWFYYVTILGIIAFALSGVAIAARDNMTLFGTLFLAFLPSSSVGIIRDTLIANSTSGLPNTSFFIFLVIIVVMIGFSTIRLLNVFNKDSKKDKATEVFWRYFSVITDAVAQSAFIIIGVIISMVAKLSPIELWGPIFAFLMANMGVMVRDLFTKNKEISVLNGELTAEISIIWGLIFSLFLEYNADNPDMVTISTGAIIVMIGAFLTRIYVIYYNVQNIHFK